MAEQKTLTVVGTVSAPVEEALRGRSDQDSKVRQVVEQAISVETLQANFSAFLDNLRRVLAVDNGRVGDLVLDEITFSVEIGADGEFKLLGAGIGASASSSLSFTLRREGTNGKVTR